MDAHWLPIADAASYAGVGASTLHAAIHDGRLSATKTREGRWLIPRAGLEDWLQCFEQRTRPWEDETRVNVKRARELSQLPKASILRYIHEGRLEAERNPDGLWLIHKSSLGQLLEDLPPCEDPAESAKTHLTVAQAIELSGTTQIFVLSAISRGLLDAEQVRRPASHGGYHFRIPIASFNGWLRRLSKKLGPPTPLAGKLVSLREAAQEVRVRPHKLTDSVRRGRLPARRVIPPHSGRVRVQVGLEEVQHQQQEARRVRWTRELTARFTGFSSKRLQQAVDSGKLRRAEGRVCLFEPDELARWLREVAPPYSQAVIGLSKVLTPAEVAQQCGLSLGEVEAAISSRELPVLQLESGECLTSRCAFESWCRARHLTPSRPEHRISAREACQRAGVGRKALYGAVERGELEGELVRGPNTFSYRFEVTSLERWMRSRPSPRNEAPPPTAAWLGVRQVAQLAQMDQRDVQAAIDKRHLEAQWHQGRWRVSRQALEDWLAFEHERRQQAQNPDLLKLSQAASLCGVSVATVQAAVRDESLPASYGSRGYLVRRQDLMVWVQTRKVRVAHDALSVADAAQLVGVDPGTLYYALRRGQLPEVKEEGWKGIRREDLWAWNKRRVESSRQRLAADPERIPLPQACQSLGVSREVLAYAVKTGRLRAEKVLVGHLKVLLLWRLELEEWARSREEA